ncbi:hypothetical protein BGZ49_001968 [Haplosporangium sp. Z 27]|nr:hypothetical protein BGZ49_001968 [Haplosporangium sp. Z 27]
MPDPITFAKITGQVQPEVVRCVCLAFVDTQWMRSDCRMECEFTGYDEAMETIPKAKDFPGCERWVDMKSLEELELQGFSKRDPDYRPVVYNYEFYDEATESTDLRSGDLLKKLTEEEILEEEDYEDCDLDEEDEINLVNRIRDEL